LQILTQAKTLGSGDGGCDRGDNSELVMTVIMVMKVVIAMLVMTTVMMVLILM
jgi:hypothetical protein